MYDIITYISNDYINILLKNISTWKRKEVSTIFIYTEEYETNDNNVNRILKLNHSENDPYIFLVPIFKKSNNFTEHCQRKAISLLHNLKLDIMALYATKNKILLDADCIISGNLNNIFDKEFNIQITSNKNVKDKHKINGLVGGVLFCKNNEKTRDFIREWVKLQNEQFRKTPSIDQISLIETIKKYQKDQKFKINILDQEIYNLYPATNVSKWIDKIKNNIDKIKIIHFTSKLMNYNCGIVKIIREKIIG